MKAFSAYIFALAITLSGCSAQEAGGPSGRPPSTDMVNRDARMSWITPGAAKESSLLYVSDSSNNEVYIYTYPSLALSWDSHRIRRSPRPVRGQSRRRLGREHERIGSDSVSPRIRIAGGNDKGKPPKPN